MKKATASRPSSKGRETAIDLRGEETFDQLLERLASGRAIRRTLVGGGRIHVDRPLPFLVLYRPPEGHSDPGTEQLVNTAPSYVIAPAGKDHASGALAFVPALVEAMRPTFGAFLLVEVSAAAQEAASTAADFTVWAADDDVSVDVLDVLVRHLRGMKRQGRLVSVEVVESFPQRRRRGPLMKPSEAERLGCHQLAIVARSRFRADDEETVYPAVLRQLRSGVSKALSHAIYRFATKHTKARPSNLHSLGRRAIVRAAWQVDERLAEISRSFDMLLSINPVGVERLWGAFRSSGFEKLPRLRYAPISLDPVLTKRLLYDVPVERIEDPSLSELFYEKQAELDRQLTMLQDRGTRRFLHGSIQLFGRVGPQLLRRAEEILERVPATMRGAPSGGQLGAKRVLELVQEELAHYRASWSGFAATARLSTDVLAGMMCSRGELLVSVNTRTPASRVDALLQHEIGTHLVTYFNGGAQRFQHLQVGFAGYEELQEGLAVFAEYAAGGMTPARLRILAARVVGAHMLMDGATFVDVFRSLSRCGFSRRASFNVTLRLFRGGGYTKDLIYLRGLLEVLRHLERGGPLLPLFVGKIGMRHLPIVQELTSRGVVAEPPVLPRYLQRPEFAGRIARAQKGMSLSEMLELHPDDRTSTGGDSRTEGASPQPS